MLRAAACCLCSIVTVCRVPYTRYAFSASVRACGWRSRWLRDGISHSICWIFLYYCMPAWIEETREREKVWARIYITRRPIIIFPLKMRSIAYFLCWFMLHFCAVVSSAHVCASWHVDVHTAATLLATEHTHTRTKWFRIRWCPLASRGERRSGKCTCVNFGCVCSAELKCMLISRELHGKRMRETSELPSAHTLKDEGIQRREKNTHNWTFTKKRRTPKIRVGLRRH